MWRLVDLPEQLRELPQRLGAEHQIHMAVGFLNTLGDPLLLGHAAAKADDLLGVLLLGVGQNAQVSEHPLLGVLPDGAGVEDDEIRLLHILRQGEAALGQHPHELLPVGHILLAAEGIHAGPGMGLTGFKHAADLLLKVPLAGKVLCRDQYVFAFQNRSSKFRYFN